MSEQNQEQTPDENAPGGSIAPTPANHPATSSTASESAPAQTSTPSPVSPASPEWLSRYALQPGAGRPAGGDVAGDAGGSEARSKWGQFIGIGPADHISPALPIRVLGIPATWGLERRYKERFAELMLEEVAPWLDFLGFDSIAAVFDPMRLTPERRFLACCAALVIGSGAIAYQVRGEAAEARRADFAGDELGEAEELDGAP